MVTKKDIEKARKKYWSGRGTLEPISKKYSEKTLGQLLNDLPRVKKARR